MKNRALFAAISLVACLAIVSASDWIVGAGKSDITGPAYGGTLLIVLWYCDRFQRVPNRLELILVILSLAQVAVEDVKSSSKLFSTGRHFRLAFSDL